MYCNAIILQCSSNAQKIKDNYKHGNGYQDENWKSFFFTETRQVNETKKALKNARKNFLRDK